MLNKIEMTAFLFVGASLPTAFILAQMKVYAIAGSVFLFGVGMIVLVLGILLYKIWTDQ